ncbi:protein geranylgeranyltransferase-like protein type I beta subunit [Umbelopsis sp. PMI_123]|nr:protein geranylgeranyltransferase-like protein type I beta subunit [Umbelopsis sp. PMI_123]
MSPEPSNDLAIKKHIAYFLYNLRMMPAPYTETETNRMTLAFFCLGSLSLLDQLDTVISDKDRKDWIDWIYAQQVLPDPDDPEKSRYSCGFKGSSWAGHPFDPQTTYTKHDPNDPANLPNTYTALANLLLLGDDLTRVNTKAIVTTIKHLQQDDGSFAPSYGSLETDIRFVFCACVISYILDDWSGVNIERAISFIRNCQSYENAMGQAPKGEAHGGSTYCGVAALTIMGKLQEGLVDKDDLINWCLARQISGFQGRPNKKEDTCYCFWIGSALQNLEAFHLVNEVNLRSFLMTTQTSRGGFGKDAESPPDVLHSYMGLATLSLMKEPGVTELDTALNIPIAGVKHLQKLRGQE